MTLQEVMKLVNAGFTADDVRKMMAEEPKQESKQESKQEQSAPAKNEKQDIEKKPEIEKPEEPKKEAAASPSFEDVISGINQKIDALAGAVNKISSISMFPSIEGIKPLGIDDVIDKFFKEE